MIRLALTAVVPLAPILGLLLHVSPTWVFCAGLVGIAVLADWIRIASDQLAMHTGPAIGGLLTVSLGSIAELLLGFFVLEGGSSEVVHAQIAGSIMGTSLLGLGIAVVIGGLSHQEQTFKRERASLLASLLVLVFIALLLPAVAHAVGHGELRPRSLGPSDQDLSLAVAIVLFALYAANLAYTLVTHRDVFRGKDDADERSDWSAAKCLLVLGGATLGAAILADQISRALTDTSRSLGISATFLGVVVLALIGTISDIFAAVFFARENKLGLVMSICIGSSIQVALVVAPLLVMLSWVIGKPLSLLFDNPLELFAIAATAFIVNSIAGDGETTWFEGVLLIGVYVLLATAFFFT